MKQDVCDLEYARALKELGIAQNGAYCWRKTGCNYSLYPRELRIKGSFDAFNSDELLRELPDSLENDFYDLTIYKFKYGFRVEYSDLSECYGHDIKISFVDKKLSNALSQMYICLKKKGYIK